MNVSSSMICRCGQGCTEKSDFIARVRETEHLDHHGGGKRSKRSKRGAPNLQGNPNDWNLPNDDYRLDLWGPLAYAVSVSGAQNPVLVTTTLPLLS